MVSTVVLSPDFSDKSGLSMSVFVVSIMVLTCNSVVFTAGKSTPFLGISPCAKPRVLINTVKLKVKSMLRLCVRNAFKCIFVKVWLGI